ncbi:MAG: SMC family ATPase [Bacteroidia bacterium]|nr:SMC family ATPase [Bacteroidia bacterium]
MIPISLSIQGIYSYQQRQDIDFTRLTSAQLFGIFGATGSGKSAILEAISFALYGECERLNQKENRSYNMMNLRSDRLMIDFTFESGGTTYRFTVSGRRNSRRFEDTGTLERRAFRLEGGMPVPLDHTSAESILGLSYDNFKRTVIIPQGKFQDFLQLTETERTRMLKEIFGLEKYELAHKAAALEQQNHQQLTRIEAQLAQLAHATPEQLADVRHQADTLAATTAAAQEQVRQVDKQVQRMEELRSVFAKIDHQQNLIAELVAHADQYDLREKNLKAYEWCLRECKPLLDRRNELADQLQRTAQTIRDKKELQHQTRQDLELAENAFEKIDRDYHERERYLGQAAELESLINLRQLHRQVQALEARILKGEQLIETNRQETTLYKQQAQEHNTQIQILRDQKPDLTQLLAVKLWHDQYHTLQLTLTNCLTSLTESQNRLEARQQDIRQLIAPLELDIHQARLAPAEVENIIRTRIHHTRETLLAGESKLEQLTVRARLQAFAAALLPGTPCPLCGATEHPDPLDTSHPDPAYERLKTDVEAQKKALAQLEKNLVQLESFHIQLIDIQENINVQEDKRRLAEKEVRQHTARFVWKAYEGASAEAIHQQITMISQLDEQIGHHERERQALENAVTQKNQERESYQAGLEKLRRERTDYEIALQTGLGKLRIIQAETYQAHNDAAINQAAAQARDAHRQLEHLWGEYQKKIRTLRSNLDKLSGEISGHEQQEQAYSQKLARQNLVLASLLPAGGYQDLAAVEQVLGLGLDIESEKNAILTYRQHLHTARATLEDLKTVTTGKSFDEVTYQALKEQLASLQQQIHDLIQAQGGLKQAQERLEQELAEKTRLESAQDQLNIRAENIRTLKNLFAKSGFVNYVSTVFLQNLCLTANERFRKLTRGALSLETTAGNNFQVRDFLNNGQVRSVKTLSGGQTFQAALSLALALADQVQQQASNAQNFFFLDEGFGSQDKLSLQIIFQTLKSLRHENRIVGIISHVEELQQEIDTYLQILHDEQTGSRILPSWVG